MALRKRGETVSDERERGDEKEAKNRSLERLFTRVKWGGIIGEMGLSKS